MSPKVNQVLSLATAALSGAAACAVVWFLWGLETPGDYFGNGSSWVGPTMVAGVLIGIVGGYYAKRYWRVAIWVVGLPGLVYVAALPPGWWAGSPL